MDEAAEAGPWRARSRRIRRLRIALPAAIAALVVVTVGWVVVRGVLAERRTRSAATGGLHMTHPRFFGRDEGGRAFTLVADEAVRDPHDLDKVSLIKPRLSLDHGAERPTTAAAPRGVYSEATRQVLLSGGVELDDGKGTRLISPAAAVDTHTGDVNGRGDVTGTSPLGHFQAASYLVRGKGAEVTFFGGVRAHLETRSETPRP